MVNNTVWSYTASISMKYSHVKCMWDPMIDCGIVGEDAISVVQLLQADLKSKYVREVDAVIQVDTGVDPGK